ncbi:hypothetical protein Tco_1131948 [Tanacetum coccineum]|uniref:Uncharacterized protein n=1 Tax=Tanacetum coccineum TaxID=301880 RepID=A0ABQ5JAK3_9ASTR
MLSLSDLSFSGGGDDEGSAAANSVMPALADGDRGLEGTGSSVGTAEGSAGARCSSSSSSSSSFSTSSSSLSSSDDLSSELSHPSAGWSARVLLDHFPIGVSNVALVIRL